MAAPADRNREAEGAAERAAEGAAAAVVTVPEAAGGQQRPEDLFNANRSAVLPLVRTRGPGDGVGVVVASAVVLPVERGKLEVVLLVPSRALGHAASCGGGGGGEDENEVLGGGGLGVLVQAGGSGGRPLVLPLDAAHSTVFPLEAPDGGRAVTLVRVRCEGGGAWEGLRAAAVPPRLNTPGGLRAAKRRTLDGDADLAVIWWRPQQADAPTVTKAAVAAAGAGKGGQPLRVELEEPRGASCAGGLVVARGGLLAGRALAVVSGRPAAETGAGNGVGAGCRFSGGEVWDVVLLGEVARAKAVPWVSRHGEAGRECAVVRPAGVAARHGSAASAPGLAQRLGPGGGSLRGARDAVSGALRRVSVWFGRRGVGKSEAAREAVSLAASRGERADEDAYARVVWVRAATRESAERDLAAAGRALFGWPALSASASASAASAAAGVSRVLVAEEALRTAAVLESRSVFRNSGRTLVVFDGAAAGYHALRELVPGAAHCQSVFTVAAGDRAKFLGLPAPVEVGALTAEEAVAVARLEDEGLPRGAGGGDADTEAGAAALLFEGLGRVAWRVRAAARRAAAARAGGNARPYAALRGADGDVEKLARELDKEWERASVEAEAKERELEHASRGGGGGGDGGDAAAAAPPAARLELKQLNVVVRGDAPLVETMVAVNQRAMCRVLGGDGGVVAGTASVVAPGVLLTPRHVYEQVCGAKGSGGVFKATLKFHGVHDVELKGDGDVEEVKLSAGGGGESVGADYAVLRVCVEGGLPVQPACCVVDVELVCAGAGDPESGGGAGAEVEAQAEAEAGTASAVSVDADVLHHPGGAAAPRSSHVEVTRLPRDADAEAGAVAVRLRAKDAAGGDTVLKGGSSGGLVFDRRTGEAFAMYVAGVKDDGKLTGEGRVVSLHAVHEELGEQSPWRAAAAAGAAAGAGPERPLARRWACRLFRVPPRLTHFVGRGEYMAGLRRRLQAEGRRDNAVAVTAPNPQGAVAVVSSGLAGAGKSTVAEELVRAEAVSGEYWLVAWLRGESVATAQEDLAALGAERLGLVYSEEKESLRQRAERARRALAERADAGLAVLLVFDNVDELKVAEAVRGLVPRAGAGAGAGVGGGAGQRQRPAACRVVYTSRDESAWDGVETVQLDMMTPGESEELFLKLAPVIELEDAGGATIELVRELCKAVGHLPLAVAQLGAHVGLEVSSVGDGGGAIASVEEVLRGTLERVVSGAREGAVAAELASFNRETARSVMAAFDVVYDSLPADGKAALRRLSVVAPERVPASIVCYAGDGGGGGGGGDGDDDDDGDRCDYSALERLAALGMVRRADGGSVSVHRLVQTHACGRSSAEETAAALGAVVRALRRHVDGFDKHSKATWGRVGAVAAHIEAVSERGGWPDDEGVFETRCKVSYELANYYQCDSSFESGEIVYKRLEKLQRERLGHNHLDVATTLNNLAALCQTQGEYRKALPLYKGALRIKKAALGVKYRGEAGTLNNLATLYKELGEYSKAQPVYEEALRIRKAMHGGGHPDVAQSLNNLAELYRAQGEYSTALPMHEEALRLRKAALGDEHAHVAQSLNNLALLHYEKGEYGKALPLFEEALRIFKAALGDKHRDVATTLNNLAMLYEAQGEYGDALPPCEEALQIRKATLGDGHRDVATSLNNLAGLYEAQGEYGKALQLYEEALRIYRVALGDGHPHVATTLNNLAMLYYKAQIEYGKALPLLEEALRIRKAALGDDHHLVGQVLKNTSLVLARLGRTLDGIAALKRAVCIYDASEHKDPELKLMCQLSHLPPIFFALLFGVTPTWLKHLAIALPAILAAWYFSTSQ